MQLKIREGGREGGDHSRAPHPPAVFSGGVARGGRQGHTVTLVLPFLLIAFNCQVAATNVLILNPFMESAIPSSAHIT